IQIAEKEITPFAQSSDEAVGSGAKMMLAVLEQGITLLKLRGEIIAACFAAPAQGRQGPDQERIGRMEAGWALADNKFKQQPLLVAAIVNKALCPDVQPGQTKKLTVTRAERQALIRYIDEIFPEAKTSDFNKDPK